ncbi:hypothetical protein C6P45_004214 [Maudiozyma exigua]|uniref:RRM domain-containing protein n=1 Tax=Maudiozyma exigua TaxID=34358 RepID=A0A9P6WBE8_MAUEX|nr:hypothetical protein C6P45_004214 [Kazachstania exigua]
MTQIETQVQKSTIDGRKLSLEQDFNINKYKKAKTTWVDPSHHKRRRSGFRQLTKAYLAGHSRLSSNNKVEPYAVTGTEEWLIKAFDNKKVSLSEHDLSEDQVMIKNKGRRIIGCTKRTTGAQLKSDCKILESETEFVSRPATVIINSEDNNLSLEPLECSTTRMVLRDIPENTGLESIVSQIKGGPLKQVTILKDPSSDLTNNTITFEFVYKADAIEFMKYANTNMFKINGIHHQVIWDNRPIVRDPKNDYLLATQDLNEPQKTRCLILKFNYKRKVTKYKNKFTNTIIKFDPEEMIKDFRMFGEIQAFTPVISRRVCVSIIFMDIRDSIMAMECMQNPTTYMYKRYHKKWTFWYGPDFTDQPCLT